MSMGIGAAQYCEVCGRQTYPQALYGCRCTKEALDAFAEIKEITRIIYDKKTQVRQLHQEIKYLEKLKEISIKKPEKSFAPDLPSNSTYDIQDLIDSLQTGQEPDVIHPNKT